MKHSNEGKMKHSNEGKMKSSNEGSGIYIAFPLGGRCPEGADEGND